jgi:hypothetical protein
MLLPTLGVVLECYYQESAAGDLAIEALRFLEAGSELRLIGNCQRIAE